MAGLESPANVFDVEAARAHFSSLTSGFAFLDAPGGTQVPDEVGDAIAEVLRTASANIGAPYETSRLVEGILQRAKDDAGRFMACSGDEVVFGINMTSVNFVLSRTATRTMGPGDEVIVTRLDHDGNVAPWLEIAEDRGITVTVVDATDDYLVDYDDLERKLSDRTRIVAFPWASNGFGSRTDAARVCEAAHRVGALAWIDAVHLAAHEPVDVAAIDADVLLCSPYKWCGPHMGMAYVRPEVAETWRPYKARPSSMTPLGRRFETGTLPYELLGGLSATISYLDSIGGIAGVVAHERMLAQRFVDGLPDGVRLYGPALEDRVPTFLINVDGVPAADAAHTLGERGFGVWHDSYYYAVGLADSLPYPGEALRVGFIHYNTADEVDRLLAELGSLAAGA